MEGILVFLAEADAIISDVARVVANGEGEGLALRPVKMRVLSMALTQSSGSFAIPSR